MLSQTLFGLPLLSATDQKENILKNVSPYLILQPLVTLLEKGFVCYNTHA